MNFMLKRWRRDSTPVAEHARIHATAVELYAGWCRAESERGVMHPKWFALREDLKARWYEIAEGAITFYVNGRF